MAGSGCGWEGGGGSRADGQGTDEDMHVSTGGGFGLDDGDGDADTDADANADANTDADANVDAGDDDGDDGDTAAMTEADMNAAHNIGMVDGTALPNSMCTILLGGKPLPVHTTALKSTARVARHQFFGMHHTYTTNAPCGSRNGSPPVGPVQAVEYVQSRGEVAGRAQANGRGQQKMKYYAKTESRSFFYSTAVLIILPEVQRIELRKCGPPCRVPKYT